MRTILIIEDDKNLKDGLTLALQGTYRILSAETLATGKRYLSGCDLLLLDINLPDGNGLDMISFVRQTSQLPIVVLSARDMEIDIITAIRMGADDYITKPFSLGILTAKIERLLMKYKVSVDGRYRERNLSLDFHQRKYYVHDEEIFLTVTEEKILHYLIEAKQMIISREILFEKLWAVNQHYIDGNTLSVHINRLRKKLAPEDPIETIYGVGYRWNY